jgi:predicted DsbA family dithiol-disulfide isomerase
MLAGRPVDVDMISAKYAAMAAELGLPFAARDRVYNSRPAHELSYWATSKQKGGAWHNAVFHAYYAHGKDISSPEVLGEIGAIIGLSREDAFDTLAAGIHKAAVDQDWALAKEQNIIAAPTYLLNGERLVGAQPYEKLQRFLESNGAMRR